MFKLRVTIVDIVILVVSLSLVVGASLFAMKSSSGKGQLVVESMGKEYAYDLSKDTTVTIHGSVGDSTISIQNGQAFFVDSPCRDKLCVLKGHLLHAGDWSACLPNRVIARIDTVQSAKDNNPVDAIAF